LRRLALRTRDRNTGRAGNQGKRRLTTSMLPSSIVLHVNFSLGSRRSKLTASEVGATKIKTVTRARLWRPGGFRRTFYPMVAPWLKTPKEAEIEVQDGKYELAHYSSYYEANATVEPSVAAEVPVAHRSVRKPPAAEHLCGGRS